MYVLYRAALPRHIERASRGKKTAFAAHCHHRTKWEFLFAIWYGDSLHPVSNCFYLFLCEMSLSRAHSLRIMQQQYFTCSHTLSADRHAMRMEIVRTISTIRINRVMNIAKIHLNIWRIQSMGPGGANDTGHVPCVYGHE